MGIQYDNSAFYYFMGTMLQFYLLPATWYNIKQFYLFLEARANVGKDLGKGRTAAERKKFERIREERKKCNNLFTSCFTVQFIILLLLWALFVFIMALAGADSEIMQFDPYKILGVETDAEMKQIKRAYRKQSLIWHPDKNPGNAAAEDKFMTIAKAYEALTDPEARENWKNYGNPDGKQSMEVSIGLPSYLMDSENHSTVMIIYLLVLVIVIPVCVWKYYSWSRAYMDAVLTETYTVFGDIKLFNQNTSMKHIPEVICMAAEFKDLDEVLKVKKAADALGNVEKKLKIKGMLPKPMFRSFEGKKIEGFFNHFRGNKLAFILMYAHLNREPIDDCLVKASEKVLKKVPLLIESLAHIGEERTKASGANPRTIAISGQWLMAVHNVLLFSQCMTQAIWYPPQNSSGRNNVGGRSLQSSLLQLPHFTSTEIGENKRGKHNQSKKREDEMKLYLRGDHLERDGESFKRGQKNFTEEQKLDVKAVEALLPDLDLSVQYGVDGEDQVVAEDLITVDFRLKRHGCETVKSGDLAVKAQPVHSAWYPFAKEEKWWAYLLYHLPKDPNSKERSKQPEHQRLLLSQVITSQDRLDSEPIYAEIDELLVKLKEVKIKEKEEDEKKNAEEEEARNLKRKAANDKGEDYDSDDSDFEEEEEDRIFDKCESLIIEDRIAQLRKSLPTRFKFRGPDQAGTYKFTVIIKSDSYLGLDHSETIAIDIAGKEVLPEFKPHKADIGLDKASTFFDQMNGVDPTEDDNDDFDDVDDFSDNEDDEPAKISKSSVVPEESKDPVAANGDDDDDDGFAVVD